MTEPLVSIVITCFNDAEFIQVSVYSALNQTYSNKEVIVVDDGSRDNSIELLESTELNIKIVKLDENHGQSFARNRGIEIAKGQFILILDGNDFFEPDFLRQAVIRMNSSRDNKIVSCHGRYISASGTKLKKIIPMGGDIRNFLFQNSAIGNSLIRKKDWEVVEGYDEEMRSGLEDWEFFIRILGKGGKAVIIPEILFNYRKHINSTTERANKVKFVTQKYIITKHEDIYRKHFKAYTFFLLDLIHREEKEKLKNLNRIEFRIGKAILWPLRKLKRLIN